MIKQERTVKDITSWCPCDFDCDIKKSCTAECSRFKIYTNSHYATTRKANLMAYRELNNLSHRMSLA